MVMNLQKLLTVHFLRFIERLLSWVIKSLYGLVMFSVFDFATTSQINQKDVLY